jgi:molybdopterin molybdotransferase
MIPTSEARRHIISNMAPLEAGLISLSEANGLVLSENIFAPLDFPAFPQSSMDGYAFSFEGYRMSGKLKITGKVAAGEGNIPALAAGQAVRIFTGAAIPEGADTVVMQEKCVVSDGSLSFLDASFVKGDHIRSVGSEIMKGELAMEKNMRLTPAAIGFLAGMGITHVAVYPPPSVCIIVTGNELQEPGTPLSPGRVYESNSRTLIAALRQFQVSSISVERVNDDLEETTRVLEKALMGYDMVLLNGGISVGELDFVLKATERCGVDRVFHRVRQKPGKPLYFGMKGEKVVFGLPGNPASVLTCFYEYVTLALSCMFPVRQNIQTIRTHLATPVSKKAGLTHFLKGYFDGKTASVLGAQESYRLRSFAHANCLIVLDEDHADYAAGEEVEIRLLPS